MNLFRQKTGKKGAKTPFFDVKGKLTGEKNIVIRLKRTRY
jgi:hypothetical protein